MLDRPSFNLFKNELKKILTPHVNFNEISTAINAIDAVEFNSTDPKSSYSRLFQILSTSSNVPVPQQSALVAEFSGIMATSLESNANTALTRAKKTAEAYRYTAMIKQDCAAAGLPVNFSNVIIFNNFNSNEQLPVITNRFTNSNSSNS